mmetsp:Transcript_10488/g.19029  ORF Transcript_10488/g.19029 Transcript_10488/m.19029 type:complete len:107 (+) Transcript_10488:41-361(+)|eukprot:CAMPEP_0202480154 /NCGR_PEP_ID=MMETSP1361-20130828/256_1 /ASSEMBLY_ACC=CAM_ASM_000849 /TAXON_ID=210615 /ORGANISM="Staurosira complex sp., Strain CCMP2646" /LENGTH=106 /DNA_ID=CAMNT_0049107565 /DNA_START=29 /DNA_END=349 /DNA_ORIENTATION=+
MASPTSNSAGLSKSFDPEDRTETNQEEMTLFVQDLLDQMQSRFKHMGDSITHRMDEMGGRLDELEKSISSLMDQAGLQPTTGFLAAAPREEDEKIKASGSDGSVTA